MKIYQHYAPRELHDDDKPTGIWHYTCKQDDVIFPAGYCGGFCTDTPCGGHSNPAEATECYRRYLLDTKTTYDNNAEQSRACAVCGFWTTRYAAVNGDKVLHLCEAHCTREYFDKYFTIWERLVVF